MISKANNKSKALILCLVLILTPMVWSQDPSIMRGIKTVVIDPGHGGQDPGCHGNHSNEKQVTLAIGLKVGAFIEENFPEINVIYTRKTDVFIELDERAAIANRNNADLFICIHANAGPAKAFGAETYVLGLHRTEAQRKIAERENSAIECFFDDEERIKGILLGFDGVKGTFRLLAPDFPDWIEEKGVGIKLAPDHFTSKVLKFAVNDIANNAELEALFQKIHGKESFGKIDSSSLKIVFDNPNLNLSQQNAVIGVIQNENITISGGDLLENGIRRNVRIVGEFKSAKEIEDIVIKQEFGNIVYLRDVANVSFKEQEKTSYAREFSQSVVMLDVTKRGGENLINASEQIDVIIAKAKENYFPSNLYISKTNDQTNDTKTMVSDLENSIILGIILVVVVLLFFLGIRNALFVGIAIPLSMFISFIILLKLLTKSTCKFLVISSILLTQVE